MMESECLIIDPLNSSCLICLESLNLESSTLSSNSDFKLTQEISARFSSSVSKFIQMNKKLNIDISQLSALTFNQNLQMCCENCFVSLEQFCKSYDQLQSLHKELLQLLYGIFLKKKTESQKAKGMTIPKIVARSSSRLGGNTHPDPETRDLNFNAGSTVRQREIPQPAVLDDLSKTVRIEVTENPTTQPYEDLTIPSSLKVVAILPNDADDNDDVATTSRNHGRRYQFILPRPQDPLAEETNVVDLDLDDNGGNEGAQEIPEPEQITITRPAPVPNILKRKRNGENPIENKKGKDEEAERMKKPAPVKTKILTSNGNNAVKKNRRFPQETAKCDSSRIKIVDGIADVDRSRKPLRHKCHYCDSSFTAAFLRLSHEMNAHAQQCRFCEKKFTPQEKVEHEVVEHLGAKPFSCLLCGMKFVHQGKCEMHLNKVHKITELEGNIERKCDKCGEIFETYQAMMTHLTSHLPELCGHGTNTNASSSSHVEFENGSSNSNSSNEEMDQGDNVEMDASMKVEVAMDADCDETGGMETDDENQTPCSSIEKPYGSVAPPAPNITAPVAEGHNPIKKNSRFPEDKEKCNAMQMEPIDPGGHDENPNNKPRPPKCRFCDSSFSSLRVCQSHELNPHPHHCRFCEKSFTLKETRQDHEVTHLGLKPFRCLLCDKIDKKFAKQGTCKTHMKYVHRMYSSEWNINIERKCEKCGQVFEKDYLVMKHIISEHLPPEDCEHCNGGRREICGHDYTNYIFNSNFDLGNCNNSNSSGNNEKMDQVNNNDNDIGNPLAPAPNTTIITMEPLQTINPLPVPLLFSIITVNANSSVSSPQSQPGEEMYRCRFCEKKFPRKGCGQQHEVSHLGLKPFRCLICSKKFTGLAGCQSHLRCVHRLANLDGKFEIKCEKCGQVFDKEHLVIKHIINQHLPPEQELKNGNKEKLDEGYLEIEATGAGAEVVTGQAGEEDAFKAGSAFVTKTEKPDESLEECFILPNTD